MNLLSMKRIFFYLLLQSAIVLHVTSFELTSNVRYDSSVRKNIELTCGDTQWNDETFITFYRDKQLIFDSQSQNEEYPLISGTKNGKTVVLKPGKVFGWEGLFCIINSVRSSNKLTIPYVSDVHLRHTPNQFYINQDIELFCDGYVLPNNNVTVLFRFDSDRIAASVTNGQQFAGNVSGLYLRLDRKGNNSVEVQPTVPGSYGKYYCSLQVSLWDNPQFEVTSPESWNTEGTAVGHSKIITANFFYTDKSPLVGLTCDDNQWNANTEIVFFTLFRDRIDAVLYNSSSTNKFPYISRVVDSKTIVLNSTGYPGWEHLCCSINRTKNLNQINVPYLAGPQFEYSPKLFQLGQNYTFKCAGFLWPASTITVLFTYNRITYASLVGGNLTLTDKVPGISIVEQVKDSNDTITIVPEFPLRNGSFNCMFLFYTHKGPETVEAHGWETYYDFNGYQSSLIARALVIALITCVLSINHSS